jgi:hypothetical protein
VSAAQLGRPDRRASLGASDHEPSSDTATRIRSQSSAPPFAKAASAPDATTRSEWTKSSSPGRTSSGSCFLADQHSPRCRTGQPPGTTANAPSVAIHATRDNGGRSAPNSAFRRQFVPRGDYLTPEHQGGKIAVLQGFPSGRPDLNRRPPGPQPVDATRPSSESGGARGCRTGLWRWSERERWPQIGPKSAASPPRPTDRLRWAEATPLQCRCSADPFPAALSGFRRSLHLVAKAP